MPPPLAVGQAVEVSPGPGLAIEGLGEVVRHSHLARFGVELDVDIDFVPGGDTGSFTVLCADREHENSTHRGDGAAVGVTLDRDPNRWLLAGSEALHHLERNLDPGGGLAAELDRGSGISHELPPGLGFEKSVTHLDGAGAWNSSVDGERISPGSFDPTRAPISDCVSRLAA